MELNLQRQSITINEVVFDGFVEQPIECDALLPDYCPDIIKVLKCSVTTNIGSTSVSGDRLTIEGHAVAHIYYASENNAIRHTEYKIPFAKAVELRSAPSYPVISVKPGVDYVNCRAVNQRRVDVRGAISLAVRVTDTRSEEVVSDAQGGGLQLRRDMVHATDLAGQHEVTFPVTEDLELGYGKPGINTILRCDCRINIQEHKVIAGKIVAKGDVLLHICYQPLDGENNLETMEYSLPVSQIIDADGTDEDCVCDVEMYLVSCDVQPRQDADGEYRVFALDARIKAAATSYRHKEIPVASDCYSTQFECSCKHRPANFIKLVDVVRESAVHKASLDLPEGVDSVLDSWCDVDSLSWECTDGGILTSMKINICLFARMEDGDVVYFEQLSDAEHRIAIQQSCEGVQFEPTADILSCDFNLTGHEKIDVRCELLLKGCVLANVKCNSLSEITVDEEKPKVKADNKLYIYYADTGESIWNIAKAYNTSANAIWEENAMEQDVLPGKTTLFIPII